MKNMKLIESFTPNSSLFNNTVLEDYVEGCKVKTTALSPYNKVISEIEI